MSDSLQKIEESFSKKKDKTIEQQKINKINEKIINNIVKMKGEEKKAKNNQDRLTCMCVLDKK